MTNYRHNFGRFQEAVRVDGVTYTSNAYQLLPMADRKALREEAVSRCGEANRRRSARLKELQEPHRAALKAQLTELRNHPKFAKRYAGRAAEMRREERYLRDECHRELVACINLLEPMDGTDYPAAVGDVFNTWEKLCETTWERFERLVTHHDWYYAYSDAHNVWAAGEARDREIRSTLKTLTEEGQGEAAQLLYNQKCPWLNEDGSQKED